MIRTVGICAGSGGSVLKDCDADLLFTGELTHHEALAATERGAAVVTLFHSNSERGFLHSVMKDQLSKMLKTEWQETREAMSTEGLNEEWEDALNDDSVAVEVSGRDRGSALPTYLAGDSVTNYCLLTTCFCVDPYGMVLLQGSRVEGTKIS